MNYITKGDIMLCGLSLNNELDYKLINNFMKIIFSDNYLDNDLDNNLNNYLFDAYENNDFYNLTYFINSKFN